jgi:uncharacterized membrane protein
MAQFKDPTMAIILSVLVGSLGVDRFYIGDVGLGVGKLLTCGGAYIWWLIDIFMIQDATKRKNMEMTTVIILMATAMVLLAVVVGLLILHLFRKSDELKEKNDIIVRGVRRNQASIDRTVQNGVRRAAML